MIHFFNLSNSCKESTLSGFKELRVTQRTSVESTDQIKERMRYAGQNTDFMHRFGPPLLEKFMEKGLHLPSIAEYANSLDMTYKVV